MKRRPNWTEERTAAQRRDSRWLREFRHANGLPQPPRAPVLPMRGVR